MAIPAIPTGFVLQQGNSQCFLSWDLVTGATSYSVQRSTDGVTYTTVSSPTSNLYLDTTVVINTIYYFQVASTNASGTSSYTAPQKIIPTATAVMSLGQVRAMAKQKADMETSQFITTAEWNTYINQSYFELYDLLVTLYEDYYLASPYDFVTTGVASYALPATFYKLRGVDCGLNGAVNAYVTLKKFDFIERNRYVYPNLTASPLGIVNMRYRLMGNNLMFTPIPQAGQPIRVWFVPRVIQLLQDTDILDGVSGWTEYVMVDAAIKALAKEESDVTVLAAQKMMLIKRIEDSAMNRDIGEPDTISDVRSSNQWGWGLDGPNGGY